MSKNKFLVLVALIISLVIFFSSGVITHASTYINGGVNISLDFGYKENMRTSEYKITDASYNNNSYDAILLSDFNTSAASLKEQGCASLVLIFQLDIKEINDGWQELYVCSDSGVQLVTPITKFAHGGSGVNQNYIKYEFYAEIDLNSITNDKLLVRYGANGWFADDWNNKNFGAQICASTESRKNSDLIYTDGAAQS